MPRTQKLMTAELRAKLPALYATEDVDLDDKLVVAHLWCPYSGQDWWIVEYDGDDTMFGAVDLGMTETPEWGYISLSELVGLRVYGGRLQAIERDIAWTPTKWSDVTRARRAS